MSYSLKFCRKVASDEKRSSFSERDWSKATEMSSRDYFPPITSFRLDGFDPDGERSTVYVELERNTDARFTHFASESFTSDGTLLFHMEACMNLMKKACCCESWYKLLKTPVNGDRVKISVGNFVLLEEYSDKFRTEEKPWLMQRTTILLPVRTEYLIGDQL